MEIQLDQTEVKLQLQLPSRRDVLKKAFWGAAALSNPMKIFDFVNYLPLNNVSQQAETQARVTDFSALIEGILTDPTLSGEQKNRVELMKAYAGSPDVPGSGDQNLIRQFNGIYDAGRISAFLNGPRTGEGSPGMRCIDFSCPVKSTFYFFWFNDANGEHVDRTMEFPDSPQYPEISYLNKEWHKRQLLEMAFAGFDIMYMVDWYLPHKGNKADNTWARGNGMKAFLEAYSELNLVLEMTGTTDLKLPKIGQLHDTLKYKSLLMNNEGKGIDMMTGHGLTNFILPILDFWTMIPPRFWAFRQDDNGGISPVILTYQPALYNSNPVGNPSGDGIDQTGFDLTRVFFAKMFGRRVNPLIINENSWRNNHGISSEANFAWGASLYGVTVSQTDSFAVIQVGPGFDERRVTTDVEGRDFSSQIIAGEDINFDEGTENIHNNEMPRRRNRDHGRVFINDFIQILNQVKIMNKPVLIQFETFNESHEANDIRSSKQLGWDYVFLSRIVNMLLTGINFSAPGNETAVMIDDAINRLQSLLALIDTQVGRQRTNPELTTRPLQRALAGFISDRSNSNFGFPVSDSLGIS